MPAKEPRPGNSSTGRTSIMEIYQGIIDRQKPKANDPAKPSIPGAKIDSEDSPAIQAKRIIWAEAKTNADFYVNAAAASGKPWFQNVRKQCQYAEFVLLDSVMAEELLKYNPHNRNMKVSLAATYSRDMENDNWIPSHEGIGINQSGNMFDGQHRVEAAVESRIPVPIWFVFNVLDAARFVTDSGAKRNVNEKLAMVCNSALNNRIAGFVKALMRGTKVKFRHSEAEIALFAINYVNVINWIGQNLPKARADVQAAIAKYYLWYNTDKGKLEKIKTFCQRVQEVQFSDENDPAKTLYLYLNRIKVSRTNEPVSIYKKTLAALEHAMKDTPCSKLYERSEDLFEWEIDDEGSYHVPPKKKN